MSAGAPKVRGVGSSWATRCVLETNSSLLQEQDVLSAAESSSWPLPLLRQVLTKWPGWPQTRKPPTSASQAVGITGGCTCLLDFSYLKSGFPISMTIVDKKEMATLFYILFWHRNDHVQPSITDSKSKVVFETEPYHAAQAAPNSQPSCLRFLNVGITDVRPRLIYLHVFVHSIDHSLLLVFLQMSYGKIN